MSRSLGNLRVDLTANSVQFVGSFQQAREVAKAFAQDATNAAAAHKKGADEAGGAWQRFAAGIFSVKGLIIEAIAAFGVEKLISGLEGAVNTVVDLGRKASRLGADVGGLSVMKFAAEEAGLDFGTLSTLIGKAEKNLGEFGRTGKGPAADAFRTLGISATDAQGKLLPVDQLIPAIAIGLEHLDDATQLDLATKIFGRNGGDQFVQWLRESGDLVQSLADKGALAQRLGVVFTDDQVEKLKQYHEAVFEIGQAWLGLRVQIATYVAPFLTEFAKNASLLVADIPKIIGNASSAISDAFAGGERGNELMRQLSYVGTDVLHFVSVLAFNTGAILLAGFIKTFEMLPSVVGPAIYTALNEIILGIDEKLLTFAQNIGFKSLQKSLAETIYSLKKELKPTAESTAEYIENINNAWSNTPIDMMSLAASAMLEIGSAGRTLAGDTGDVLKFLGAFEPLPEVTKNIHKAAVETSAWARTWGQFTSGFKAGWDEVKKQAEDVAAMGRQVATVLTEQLAGGAAKALAEAEVSGQKFSKSMHDVLNSVAIDILTLIQKMILLRGEMAALGLIGFGGAGLGPGANLGDADFSMGGRTAFAAHGLALSGGRVLGLASGGVLTSPTLVGMTSSGTGVVAGEAGPEAGFAPLKRIGGNLGVGAVPAQVSVQIIDMRSSGARPTVSEGRSADGGRMISVLIRDEVNAGIGSGAFDGSLGSSFGLSRGGIGR